MEYRGLEITVISAKDLKKVNPFGKTHPYVVVSLTGDPRACQQQTSAVDRTENASPNWNFPMKFTTARSNGFTVTFRIRCDLPILGDKDIGVVHVPLSELIGYEDGKPQLVTYQVRRPQSGKPKGERTFSYRWGEKIVSAPPAKDGFISTYQPPPPSYPYQPQQVLDTRPSNNHRGITGTNWLPIHWFEAFGKAAAGYVFSDVFNHLGSDWGEDGAGGSGGGGCGGS